jgi:hypothetical protein
MGRLIVAKGQEHNSGREQQIERRINADERIQFMKPQGLTIPQIAGKLVTDPRSVRKRLQLLRMTAEGQRA